MSFSRKRGRPSNNTSRGTDLGTPELIKKRAYTVTAEPIDICLEKGIISSEQHWCAIHLRWLYTLRYGVPSVKSLDPTHLGGRELSPDSPEWRREREKEYHEALEVIASQALVRLLLEICVYNQRPSFLRLKPATNLSDAQRQASYDRATIEKLQLGLDRLTNFWCRQKKATASQTDRSVVRKNL